MLSLAQLSPSLCCHFFPQTMCILLSVHLVETHLSPNMLIVFESGRLFFLIITYLVVFHILLFQEISMHIYLVFSKCNKRNLILGLLLSVSVSLSIIKGRVKQIFLLSPLHLFKGAVALGHLW